jgi:hypothetical protein
MTAHHRFPFHSVVNMTPQDNKKPATVTKGKASDAIYEVPTVKKIQVDFFCVTTRKKLT